MNPSSSLRKVHRMISPKSPSHFAPAQSSFNIGDRVCWNLAAQWKLKDTIGSIVGAVDWYSREQPTFKVEFAFGEILLHAGQITRVTDKALPPAEQKALPVRRKMAFRTTGASKGGMLIPRAKALHKPASPAR